MLVRLLGVPDIFVDGSCVPLRAKEAGLIAFLTLDGGPVRREQAARLLWPSSFSSAARHSLSQGLYSLRKKLGPSVVLAAGSDAIGLQGLNVDAVLFRDALNRSDWRLAGNLYRGALLEGVEVSGGNDFDDWLDRHRSRFIDMARQVVEGLHLDGLVDHARDLGARLDGLPGMAESEIPVRIADDARQSPPFVGRADILDHMEHRFEVAATRGFHTLVVQGEAGIGKTSLIHRFARRRALRGGTTLSATGYSGERNVPFGVVAQWLRDVRHESLMATPQPWRGILAKAFPGASDDVGAEVLVGAEENQITGEYRVIEALRRLFITHSRRGPMLVLLDDAQHADAASLGFIHYLQRRSPDTPILFLAAARVAAPVGEDPFGDWAGVERVPLEGLRIQEIEALLARVRPEAAVDPREVTRIADRTGRNPLLIASLLDSDGPDHDGRVPDRIVGYFLPRLRTLSRDSRLLLGALSLTGESSKLAAHAAGLSRDRPGLAAAIRELQEAGLIVGDGEDRLRPRHGIVTEVALQGLTPADRKTLHGRAARILAEDGRASPAVLAVKHDIAGDRASAYRTAIQAADASAALHAVREQEYFLKVALSNAGDAGEAAGVRIRLGDLYYQIGRYADALELLSPAGFKQAAGDLRNRAAAFRLRAHLRFPEALVSIEDAREEIDRIGASGVEPSDIALLLVEFGLTAGNMGEGAAGVSAARQALQIIEDLPVDEGTTLAAIGAASIVGTQSDVAEGLRELDGIRGRMAGTAREKALFAMGHGSLLIRSGRLAAGEGDLLESIELAERYAVFDRLDSMHNNLGVGYMEQGDHDQAEGSFREALRVASVFALPWAGDIAADNLALLEYERGNHAAALDLSIDALRSSKAWSRGLFTRHGMIGLASLELGDLAMAYDAGRDLRLLLDRHEYWGSDFSYVEMFLARLLIIEGKQLEARRRLETAIDMYRRRDLLARARLELELARLDLRSDPRAAAARASAMLELLRDTGARPLIERFQDVADSASVRALR